MANTKSSIKEYSEPWTEIQLRHLLRRSLFGVTLSDYDFFKGKSMDECIEILLTQAQSSGPPMWDTDDPNVPKGTSYVFASEDKDRVDGNILGLKAWWVGHMLNPQKSITDKMVLFWHNHFAVEFSNVLDSRYAYQYLCILRQYATGNFKKLAKEITTTPCMLVYLNGNLNNKTAPNENYGRELQELFTVGKDPDSHYTEVDVKAAAKVLSGWKDDKKKISSYFDPAFHNSDDKAFSSFYNNHTIKGRNSNDGAKETDDLIEMICNQTEVAKFLCRKLYRWFIHYSIDEKIENDFIAPLADIMIQSNYEIKPVLKALLRSTNFYDPYIIGGMFKSPVDFMIGLLRECNVKFSDDIKRQFEQQYAIVYVMRVMGQDIGDPPSVAGWPAYYEYPIYYKNWINSENLSFRNKVARILSYPEEGDGILEIDYLHFANSLPDPASSKAIVSDSLYLLCPILPPNNKISYLENLLDSEHDTKEKWNDLWMTYKSDQANDEVQKKITHRLRKVYETILTFPEFHIM